MEHEFLRHLGKIDSRKSKDQDRNMADPVNAESAIEMSDCDSQPDELEIILDDEKAAISRRRSSIMATYEPFDDEHPSGTDCYVHQLLDDHRRSATNSPMSNRPSLDAITNGASSDKITSSYFKSRKPHANNLHSRHLNKKQLSDMAFSIRELSKELSHIKLKLNVQNVFILGKIHDDEVIKLTSELTDWLLCQDSTTKVYVEDTLQAKDAFNCKGLLAKDPSYSHRLKYWDNNLCRQAPQLFDIVIALGGDGTVLYASWLFQRVVPPVLSFALGSLGFLTKFDFDKHKDSLSTVFRKGFNVNLRLRFEATIMRKKPCDSLKGKDIVDELIGDLAKTKTHDADGCHNILNEVVLDRGPSGTMVTLEIFGDQDHFTTVQADGICVATPTGSTAYNLAAGGSLCHPDNPVVLLTAICAHTLSFRPVILPDTIVLRIAVPYDTRTHAWASFDGRERVELFPGDYVTISASRFPFPSVMPVNTGTENWIDSISRTLNWNSRQRQKSWQGDD